MKNFMFYYYHLTKYHSNEKNLVKSHEIAGSEDVQDFQIREGEDIGTQGIIKKTDNQEADYEESDVQETVLQEGDYEESNVQETDLQDKDYEESDDQEADYEESDVQESNVQEADDQEADYEESDVQEETLKGSSDDTKGLSMSLPNNLTQKIILSILPILFRVRNVYLSNLPVLFMIKLLTVLS